MTFEQLTALSLLQGVTEFLPVSSSGHLILFSDFFGFADQGVVTDIALHVGSLIAVLLYFRQTFACMISGFFRHYLWPDLSDDGSRLTWLVIVATLPILVVGFLVHYAGFTQIRNPKLIGWTILLYGLLLYVADKKGKTLRELSDLRLKDAILIGMAQCLALVPGTSRSGITITMMRFSGINRYEAARFSMLISVPSILAAAVYACWRLYQTGETSQAVWAEYGVILSFIFSISAICLMMKWLKKSTYLPFVIYRVILGLCLILWS